MLPSKTDPMKVSQEIGGSKVNIRFGHALKCCLQKRAFGCSCSIPEDLDYLGQVCFIRFGAKLRMKMDLEGQS